MASFSRARLPPPPPPPPVIVPATPVRVLGDSPARVVSLLFILMGISRVESGKESEAACRAYAVGAGRLGVVGVIRGGGGFGCGGLGFRGGGGEQGY